MATINTSDDILRVLSENPEWKAAVRREILTEELIDLPARFERFVAKTEQFIQDQLQFNADQLQFNADQRQFNAKVDVFIAKTEQFIQDQLQFNADQRQFNAKVDVFIAKTEQFIQDQRQFNANQREFNAKVNDFMERTDQQFARVEQRFGRIERDISNMRGEYARNRAVREADYIAQDMGLQIVQTLTEADISEMLRTADTTDIATAELRSFRRADMIIAALDGEAAPHYIAVEISNLADDRDTRRAIRNADYLTRFTGCPAHPAIASVRNDERIRGVIGSGQVYWYELEDRDAQPE